MDQVNSQKLVSLIMSTEQVILIIKCTILINAYQVAINFFVHPPSPFLPFVLPIILVKSILPGLCVQALVCLVSGLICPSFVLLSKSCYIDLCFPITQTHGAKLIMHTKGSVGSRLQFIVTQSPIIRLLGKWLVLP